MWVTYSSSMSSRCRLRTCWTALSWPHATGLHALVCMALQVCYSWWCLSALSILGRLHWIDQDALTRFILFCQVRMRHTFYCYRAVQLQLCHLLLLRFARYPCSMSLQAETLSQSRCRMCLSVKQLPCSMLSVHFGLHT